MTELMYKKIYDDTEKAIKYLHKKGCFFICDSIPSGYDKAKFSIYKVSDVNEKMKKHIEKQYPLSVGMIEYTSREEIVSLQLERNIAFYRYRINL